MIHLTNEASGPRSKDSEGSGNIKLIPIEFWHPEFKRLLRLYVVLTLNPKRSRVVEYFNNCNSLPERYQYITDFIFPESDGRKINITKADRLQ